LVITQGARIDAVGTPDAPIVFTSSKTPGMRARGDWGGLLMLGGARINAMGGHNNVEGLPITESRGTYGGTDQYGIVAKIIGSVKVGGSKK
jgi:hypothetical protein